MAWKVIACYVMLPDVQCRHVELLKPQVELSLHSKQPLTIQSLLVLIQDRLHIIQATEHSQAFSPQRFTASDERLGEKAWERGEHCSSPAQQTSQLDTLAGTH